MKHFILLLFMSFATTTFAQKITGAFADGRTLTSSSSICENDEFKLIANEDGQWMLYFFRNDDSVVLVDKQIAKSVSFKAKDIQVNWHKLKRFSIEGDSSVYFKGYAKYVTPTQKDSIFLLFNMLPSLPSFKNIELMYDGFNYRCLTFVNANIRYKFYAARATTFFDGTSDDLYKSPKMFFNCFENYDHLIGQQKDYFDLTTWGLPIDWDIFVRFSARNKYGDIDCDTIYVYDLIKDQHILEAINNYTGINDNETNKISIVINNCFLEIKGLEPALSVVHIFSASGQLIYKGSGKERIPLDSYPRGMYFVKVNNKNNIVSRKILLR